MPVYVDPTEVREGTRLPKGVIESSQVLAGLESRTGADFLVTPACVTMPGDISAENDLTKFALTRACEHGVLVQRKSGGDFVSSIPHLSEIQERMRRWAHPGGCILLVVGLEFSGGKVVAGGRSTEWTVGSVKGAFRAWRFRGGHIETLAKDQDIGPWLAEMHESVTGFFRDPTKVVMHRDAVQRLVTEPMNWVTTGSGFPPGIGRAKRESIARYLSPGCDPVRAPPPFIRVQDAFTSGRVLDAAGIGEVLLRETRAYWGLRDDRRIRDVPDFRSVTITFTEPLPVELSGDGIEVSREGQEVSYRFSSYTALETLDLILSAMDWHAGRKG